MAEHNLLGRKGERQAEFFLRRKGYSILQRNWRYKRAEIDIVARKDKMLVVVEVKTRHDSDYGEPWEFVGPDQQKRLIDAGVEYAQSICHDGEIRFDIISIRVDRYGAMALKHVEDAFFPGLEMD